MHAAARILLLFTALTLPTAGFAASAWPDTNPSITRDKHGRIARSTAAKNAFKKEHPCPITGRPKGACPG